jgi:hypothetical protein
MNDFFKGFFLGVLRGVVLIKFQKLRMQFFVSSVFKYFLGDLPPRDPCGWFSLKSSFIDPRDLLLVGYPRLKDRIQRGTSCRTQLYPSISGKIQKNTSPVRELISFSTRALKDICHLAWYQDHIHKRSEYKLH